MSHGRFDNPVVASLAGFLDRFRKQEKSGRLTSADRADRKTCIVTGASSGLGFAVAVEMARRGARVIMANRNRSMKVVEKARKISGSADIDLRYIDLSRIGTIHTFVDGLKSDNILPDVTIFNAGVALPSARMTESGQDEMFLVNYLSNVILTNLLLAKGVIPHNPPQGYRPRLIYISSDSHQGCSAIDYKEFGRFIRHGVSKGIENYSYFKLILNTFVLELSRRLSITMPEASALIICPGPVNTNITRAAPFPLRMVLNMIFSIIFRSPEVAALPVVYMALSSDYEGRSGEYLHMFRDKKMDPKVYIPEEGIRLWKESWDLWQRIDPLFIPVLSDHQVGNG